MLTLFHAPKSRSTRIIWLLEELGADYALEYITISRRNGTGGPDAANPNLLKQAPTLVHHGQVIHESVIILLYLTDLYPQAGLAPRVGDAARAAFMAWLGLYNAVLEPTVGAQYSPGGPTEIQKQGFTALVDAWQAALRAGPYLLGERFSAVDILFASLLQFARSALPDDRIYDEWLERVSARAALTRALAKDNPP